MSLESKRDFRLGCSLTVALTHLSKGELTTAIKAGKIEEVGGLYYSTPSSGTEDTRSYLGKEKRPLKWCKGCEWALPSYAP